MWLQRLSSPKSSGKAGSLQNRESQCCSCCLKVGGLESQCPNMSPEAGSHVLGRPEKSVLQMKFKGSILCLAMRKPVFFVLCEPSNVWMRPNHIVEINLLYPKFTNLNILFVWLRLGLTLFAQAESKFLASGGPPTWASPTNWDYSMCHHAWLNWNGNLTETYPAEKSRIMFQSNWQIKPTIKSTICQVSGTESKKLC
jgi:hypothetical protein